MPKVILGDIVDRIKDKIDKDNTDLEYYIGGEHFDYGEVQITKKAPIIGSTIGPAFHMRFKPGDVLLMSRNPHLRKAGMVDFEGLCSDVSYVCRTKDESVLLQRYLPFIFQTDSFWEFAESNKKGSTNFFLNWSDFAQYELYLPEIEKQQELAELLWAAVDTKVAYRQLLNETECLVNAQFIEMFGEPVDNTLGWETKGLLELGDCKNGMNFGGNENGVSIHSIGVGDIKDLSVIDDIDALSQISLNSMPSEEYLLRDEDIVFVRSNGNKNLVGRCVMVYPQDKALTFSGFCIRFRKSSDRVLTRYLLQLLKLPSVRKKMAGRGANIQNLNQKILGQLEIPIPPLEIQQQYVDFVYKSELSKLALNQSIESTTSLIRSLSQQDFEK